MQQHDPATGGATLYIHKGTRLHRLHPFTKLCYIVATAVLVYLGPNSWSVEISLISLSLIAALEGGIIAAFWRLAWCTMLPLALFMTVIHGFLHPDNNTILFTVIDQPFYQEGLLFTASILLQLAALLSASLLFVLSTHPADLVTAITEAGWPTALAYLVGSPLLLLPAMRRRIRTIQAAQRSRGLDLEGNRLKRFRALFAIMAPLVLGSLIDIEQRAIALELRGFNAPGRKTNRRRIADSSSQKILRLSMIALCLPVIIFSLLSP